MSLILDLPILVPSAVYQHSSLHLSKWTVAFTGTLLLGLPALHISRLAMQVLDRITCMELEELRLTCSHHVLCRLLQDLSLTQEYELPAN